MTEADPHAALPRAASSPLVSDVHRAERILFDLAGQLRRVPVHQTLPLHLRALQIKQLVMRWSEELSGDASRQAVQAVIDELLTLRREVDTLCLQ
jgi:hypothetical protein